MIEITIPRVRHSTQEEARKLIQYVVKCDVFSPELAMENEPEAKLYEALWYKQVVSGDITRSKVKKALSASEDTKQKEYSEAVWGYIAKNRKTIFYSERFDKEAALELRLRYNANDTLVDEAIKRLEYGEIESFLVNYWKALGTDREIMETRDREIARNLDRAEEYLRETYSHLKDKHPLKLNGFVGFLHNPQKYTKTPIQAPTIAHFEPIQEEYLTGLDAGLTFDQMKLTLLKFGARSMARDGLLNLAVMDLEQMDFDQVSAEIKKQAKNHRYPI